MLFEIVESGGNTLPQAFIIDVLEYPAQLQCLLHIPEQPMPAPRMLKSPQRATEMREVNAEITAQFCRRCRAPERNTVKVGHHACDMRLAIRFDGDARLP